jgi:hypothetical protein
MGFEPMIRVLQDPDLPLGYARCVSNRVAVVDKGSLDPAPGPPESRQIINRSVLGGGNWKATNVEM